MPHNHPPNCCCQTKPNPDAQYVLEALHCAESGSAGHWPTAAGYLADEIHRLCGDPDSLDLCPSCPEHGELARLSAFDGVCGFRHLIAPDQTCTSKPHPPGTPHSWDLPEECDSCHQLKGRPPTDYCLHASWHGVLP